MQYPEQDEMNKASLISCDPSIGFTGYICDNLLETIKERGMDSVCEGRERISFFTRGQKKKLFLTLKELSLKAEIFELKEEIIP